MGKKFNIRIGYISAIVITIAAIILIYIISVKSDVIKLDALPSNFIGSGSGALIGALITYVLLRGQTNHEKEKEKDVRILQKKAEVFQDFIKSIWKIWQDQEITIDSFDELTRQYYQNIMIYLNDEKKLKIIGNELTKMGGLIDKTDYKDCEKLRESVIEIINELSDDIGLGGKINPKIMDEHDRIVFSLRLKEDLLRKLNEELNVYDDNSHFKEGKYETIWDNKNHNFFTFEMKKYTGIKLMIGPIGIQPHLFMVFMADPNIQELDEFRNKGTYWKRILNQVNVSAPIPDDKYEDKTEIPVLNFSDKESMEIFRKEIRNLPEILSKRVKYRLDLWEKEFECKTEKLGYIQFFEKYLKK